MALVYEYYKNEKSSKKSQKGHKTTTPFEALYLQIHVIIIEMIDQTKNT